jgi:enoyl-CoA hydratase
MVRSWIIGTTGHVELDRPAALNALDRPLIAALHAAIDEVGRAPAVRCLVLSGAGTTFSAGGDVHAIRAQSTEETFAQNEELLAAIAALEALPVPSIAALHGNVLGGGLELALGCTLRVVEDGARLGLPEVRLGLIPGSGGVARLPALIGRSAALRLLVTGSTVDAQEAVRLGLAHARADSGRLDDDVATLAGRIAQNSPRAVRAVLELVRDQSAAQVQDALAASSARLPEILAGEDLREGLDAFIERRPPRWD